MDASPVSTSACWKPLWIAMAAAGLVLSTATEAGARDRPGTPRGQRAYECSGSSLQAGFGGHAKWDGPPSVCVEFENTAKEAVIFDAEVTENGRAMSRDELKSRAGCLFSKLEPPSGVAAAATRVAEVEPQRMCSAAANLAGIPVPTQVGRPASYPSWLAAVPTVGIALAAAYAADPRVKQWMDREGRGGDTPLQGLELSGLDFDAEYCLRFKARDADTGVVSLQWSGWACARTPGIQKPPAPAVTAKYREADEWDARGTKKTFRGRRFEVGWRADGCTGHVTVAARAKPGEEGFLDYFRPTLDADFPPAGTWVYEIPPKARVDAVPTFEFRACAHNVLGRTCSEWVPTVDLRARGIVSRPEGVTPRDVTEPSGVVARPEAARDRVMQGPAVVSRPGRPAGDYLPPKPDLSAVATVARAEPGGCKPGFVWREARPDDRVCVTPEARARVAGENASAASHVDANGAYGPSTCLSGYVWREAFAGDLACVTPQARDLAREENRLGPSRAQ